MCSFLFIYIFGQNVLSTLLCLTLNKQITQSNVYNIFRSFFLFFFSTSLLFLFCCHVFTREQKIYARVALVTEVGRYISKWGMRRTFLYLNVEKGQVLSKS